MKCIADRRTRINTCSGTPAGPTDVSRGIFGATVGIDRILKLLDKYGIKATWFVPGHSVESFPGQMNKVRDGGHEMFVIIISLPCMDWADLVVVYMDIATSSSPRWASSSSAM